MPKMLMPEQYQTPLYIEVPTMPAGLLVQIDWSGASLGAAFLREEWKVSGKIIIDEALKRLQDLPGAEAKSVGQ